MMSTIQQVELRRLLLFGIVGGVNTAICYALFAALVYALRWHYDLALVADYAFGIVLGYILHRIWTFADRTHVKQAFGKYAFTLVLAFFVNLAVLDWTVRHNWLGPLAAQGVAMTVATLMSYVSQKHWVFRSHGDGQFQQAQTPKVT